MLQINVHDKTIQLDDLIQAAKRGEEVVIVTDEQEIFRLVQVEKPKRRPEKRAAPKGLVEIAADFDAPLEDFKDYT